MARVRSSREGTTKRESQVPPSRTSRARSAFSFAVAGALSFWLPDVAVHIEAGSNFDSRHVWAITILMAATFLLAYVVSQMVAAKLDFKWVGPAMLIGVWLSGGLFITLAALVSGSSFAGSGIWRLVVIVLSVIPIVTFILAAWDGSLYALLAVTLGAILLCGIRASWMLLTSASPNNLTSKNQAQPPKVA